MYTLFRIFCFFLATASAIAQHPRWSIDRYKPEMSQTSLMACWSFNQGSAIDTTPHSFALSENGSITYTGRGAILDASGDYFDFDEYGGTVTFFQSPYYIYGDAFTISGWVTWTDNTKHTGLFEFYRAGNMDFGIYNYYSINATGHAHPVTYILDSAATDYDVLIHYALTWDGGELILYRDGVERISRTSASTPYFLSSAYTATIQSDIGKVHSYSGYAEIYGHLKYYSLARTESQIMREYQEGPHR